MNRANPGRFKKGNTFGKGRPKGSRNKTQPQWRCFCLSVTNAKTTLRYIAKIYPVLFAKTVASITSGK